MIFLFRGRGRSDYEGAVRKDVTYSKVRETDKPCLNDAESYRFSCPRHIIRYRSMLMSPDDSFYQLLPVTPPGNEEHEARCPYEVAK